MEISLIRHGKSKHIENNKITCLEFNRWVEHYDTNGVFQESTYPSVTLQKMTTSKLIITSDLTRSVESARLLNNGKDVISNPLFREIEMPTIPMKLFNMKLKPNIWAVILRLLWFTGYSNGCESMRDAKIRAVKASQQLIEHAEEYESVALVGHGFFNMLIAKELLSRGLKGKRKTRSKNWGCTTYSI